MALMRGTIKAAIMLVWVYSASAWAAGGYVHEAVGEVLVAVGKNPSRPVVKNSEITSNTIVTTGEKSHSVLRFEDGQIVAMQANSAFNVGEYRFEQKNVERSNIVFSSLKGGLLFITGLIGKRSKQSFRLTTPNATIGVRGTEFMVVMVDGALYGKVISGSISLSNNAGDTAFEAGQTILALSPDRMPVSIPAADLPVGLFDQLEAIKIPPSETSPLPVPGDGGKISGEPLAAFITGSTLVNSAAMIAGGISPVPMVGGTPSLLDGASTIAGAISVGLASIVPVQYDILAQSSAVASDTRAVFPVGSPTGAPSPSAAVSAASSDIPIVQPDVPDPSSANAADQTNSTPVIPPSRWYDDKFPPLKANLVPAPVSSEAEREANGDARLFGKHNFTPGRVGTGEICVFCHTPQGSEDQVAAPLWNRTINPLSEYKAYSSIGSATAAATGSVSMACLSCHDGTQAPNIVINSPADIKNAKPEDQNEVVTRNYLKDHHPVSMLYAGGGQSDKLPDAPVDALAVFNSVDYDVMAVRQLTAPEQPAPGFRGPGQPLRYSRVADMPPSISRSGMFNKADFNQPQHSGSGSGTIWWLESRDTGKGRQKKDFYLYTRTDTVDGRILNRPYVECASCHDPHTTNPTFLRISNSASAVCLTCHAK